MFEGKDDTISMNFLSMVCKMFFSLYPLPLSQINKSAVPYIPFISLSWDTFQFCSRTENMFILASLGKIA